MTREEYFIETWRDYYQEAVNRGVLAPTEYADKHTKTHMAHRAAMNKPPWDMAEIED